MASVYDKSGILFGRTGAQDAGQGCKTPDRGLGQRIRAQDGIQQEAGMLGADRTADRGAVRLGRGLGG